MKQCSTIEFSTKKEAIKHAKIMGKNNGQKFKIVRIYKTTNNQYVVIFLINESDIYEPKNI